MREVRDNATYVLQKLDGTQLKVPIVGKRIKLFWKRGDGHAIEGFEDIVDEDKDIYEENLNGNSWTPTSLVATNRHISENVCY